jgi:hypothetical protein
MRISKSLLPRSLEKPKMNEKFEKLSFDGYFSFAVHITLEQVTISRFSYPGKTEKEREINEASFFFFFFEYKLSSKTRKISETPCLFLKIDHGLASGRWRTESRIQSDNQERTLGLFRSGVGRVR